MTLGRTAASKLSETGQERVTVALGFDADFVPYVGVAISTVAKAFQGRPLHFILLTTGVGADSRQAIEACAPGCTWSWIEVTSDQLPVFKGNREIEHVSAATLLRMALEWLAPAGTGRVLYIDGDVLAFGDLTALWETDLGDNALGAVMDPGVDAEALAAEWGCPPPRDGYFNAGVLLIDLPRVQADKTFSRALEFFASRPLVYADQDALNWAFWNKWTPLAPAWNFQHAHVINAMGTKTDRAALAKLMHGGILHFTTFNKPWRLGTYHPWGHLFWAAAAKTTFLKDIAARNAFSTWRRYRLWLRWIKRRHIVTRRPRSAGLPGA